MAQSYISDAGVLIIPGAYPSIKVQTSVGGLATTGVIMLVGEADGGPDYSLEADLQANAFGPDQIADVRAKYLSGPLVDAFSIAAQPANDPDITGSPNRFIFVKTNPSLKASGGLDASGDSAGAGNYGDLFDKNYGLLGNLIAYTVSAKQSEIKPTTGAFTYIPPVDTVNMTLRANGGAALALALTANETPTAFVSAVDGLSGIDATGGADRSIVTVSGTLAVAATGNNIVLTRSVAWTNNPTVGDTLVISSTSAIKGGSNQNVGAYVITAVTNTTIAATKLSDAGKSGAVVGTITAPITVSAQSIVSTTADAQAFGAVTITLTGSTIINGQGKTLEINQLTTGNDLAQRCLFVLGTTTPVTWLSKSGSPKLLLSAAEYIAQLNTSRQLDSVTENIAAGGQIMLRIGYQGTSCSVTVGPTTLTTTVTGGTGSNLALNLKLYPTLADLAAFISAQTGYTAAVGSNAVASFSPLALDEGTWSAGSDWGNMTLRIKADAVKFFTAVRDQSVLVQLGNPPATELSGLPQVNATVQFLAGGARGATTDSVYVSAVDALEHVQGNFLVPLFSRDASADVADGLTDSASSYTIANVQAYAKTHVLKMSTLKKRRNRQAFLANRGTFAAAKDAAQTLASYRAALAFQDTKVGGAQGVVQYQPHMSAALAAGMQAAGFYRAIFNKGINSNGFIQAAGDFKDTDESKTEDGLLAGLLIAKRAATGGFTWVSDQTTYSKDDNFFFNSIQAVYAGDVVALTTAQRMETAFVGQSVADVTATIAMSALEAIMADLKRLKLIAASDDAPKGFKNAKIRISGTVMLVTLEIKLAGAIYFIPINFTVSQVDQSATSA